MPSSRNAARAVGVLFLVSYVGWAVGVALLGPALDVSTDLATIDPDRAQLITGALFEFLNVAAIIGIAVLLFPYLKRSGEGLALAYVASRILEGAILVFAMISSLSLITLSEEYIEAGAPDGSYFDSAHALVVGQGHWTDLMATVAFILGAAVLYSLLYRSALVPRFISVWGLVAVAMLTAGNILVPDLSDGFQPAALLFLPIVLNELFLAIWLIVKGFTPSARTTAGGMAQ